MFKEEVLEIKALPLPLWKMEGKMRKKKIRFVVPGDCSAYIYMKDILIPLSSKDLFDTERFYKNKYEIYLTNNKVKLNIKFGFNIGEIKYENYELSIKSGCHGQIDYEIKLNDLFVRKYIGTNDVEAQIVHDYRPSVVNDIEIIFKKFLIENAYEYNSIIANLNKIKKECLAKVNDEFQKNGLLANKMELKIEETEDVKGYKEEVRKSRKEVEIDFIVSQKHDTMRVDVNDEREHEIAKIRAEHDTKNIVGYCPKCGTPHQDNQYCAICGTKLKGDGSDVF